jgi:hypothetical protein
VPHRFDERLLPESRPLGLAPATTILLRLARMAWKGWRSLLWCPPRRFDADDLVLRCRKAGLSPNSTILQQSEWRLWSFGEEGWLQADTILRETTRKPYRGDYRSSCNRECQLHTVANRTGWSRINGAGSDAERENRPHCRGPTDEPRIA